MESPSEPGAPSPALARAMSPELAAGGVAWRGVGRCAPLPAATRAPDTYPPVTRNQVDHLTATVGHMFVYKVPEVSVRSARRLRISASMGSRNTPRRLALVVAT